MQIICIDNIFLNNFINYTFVQYFWCRKFSRSLLNMKTRKLIKFAFILMYFIGLWISYVFFFFFFLCILLFYDLCCLRSSFGSISSWINDIQSKKRTKLLIYRQKWKIHFAICFVHKMKKFSLFGLTFGRKRSRDSVTGGPIFANLVSKYPQDFKEESHEARQFCVRDKICLEGASETPPPSAVRVTSWAFSSCPFVRNKQIAHIVIFPWGGGGWGTHSRPCAGHSKSCWDCTLTSTLTLTLT